MSHKNDELKRIDSILLEKNKNQTELGKQFIFNYKLYSKFNRCKFQDVDCALLAILIIIIFRFM